MRTTISTLWCFAALASLTTATPARARSADIYMGGPVTIMTRPNGVRMNAAQAKGSLGGYAPKTEKVAPGVWSIIGHSIVNVHVVEGETGLIVVDTGVSAKEGAAVLAEIRKFSAKPVRAIIYTHAHYASGAAVLAEGQPILVIGHPSDNAKAADAGIGGTFPETMPVQAARGIQQLGADLPATGPDASAGERVPPIKSRVRLAVNHPAQDGEELVFDGVRFQFFTRNTSDAESVTIWLPDLRVVANNFYWPVAANLFAPRGDVFRDARSWISGLKQIRDLQPDLMLSTHALAVSGRENIRRVLEHYIDFHSALLDQSLRGILKGLDAEDLRHFVKLPTLFEDILENYGETISWYPPAVYQQTFGWYSGDAAELNPVDPDFRRRGLVQLMGGPDAVLAAARAAEDRAEWAWALELVNYVYRTQPEYPGAKKMIIGLLRKHAELTPASVSHNFYMAQALELEGKLSQPTRAFYDQLLKNTPPCDLLNAYRVRIVPDRTVDLRGLIAFDTGESRRCGLFVRPGVAEYIPDAEAPGFTPVAIVTLTRDAVTRLYRGDVAFDALVANSKTSLIGSREKATRLAEAFELLPPDEHR